MAHFSYHITATATDGTRRYLARTEESDGTAAGDVLIWTEDPALAIHYSHGRARQMAKAVSYVPVGATVGRPVVVRRAADLA